VAYDPDYLIDRRRLKRRLTFWRVVAIVAVVGAVVAAWGRFGGGLSGDRIVRVDIDGVIVRDDRRIETIAALGRDSSVRAVLVRINSPGGTVTGGESLYRAVLELGEKKPVVALMDGLATSAAYMVAIAADRIYAHETTLTGSIGVVMQTAEITRLLDMVGITPRAFKSGELKASPNPMEPVTPAAVAAMQAIIDETYASFRNMVLVRRQLDAAAEAAFSDGRVFTGKRAREIGLIDAIGGQREAVAWLERERTLPEGLPVHEIDLHGRVGDLLDRVVGLARKTILSERLTLDGLVSVWQPPGR
jgi:protease-4